jgi:prolyl oligopeptidase
MVCLSLFCSRQILLINRCKTAILLLFSNIRRHDSMKIWLPLLFLLSSMHTLNAQTPFKPPVTPTTPVTETLHGRQVTDNFRWLEDKTNPDVIAWTKAQHDYTLGYINATMPEIRGLRDEFLKYLDRDLKGAPFFRGNRQFFQAKKKGDLQYKLYTIENGKERLLFDPLSIDPSGKTSISGMDFNRDASKLAIGTQTKGDEINFYRILDVATGKQEGEILNTINGFSWTYDQKHAYISIRTKEIIKNQEPIKNYLWTVGTPQESAEFLSAPDDAKDVSGVWDTDEETGQNYTFFSQGDFYSNTLKIRSVGTNDTPKLIYSSKEARAYPHLKNGKLYFFTNDHAPNFKLMVTDATTPEFKNWKDFIPEKETVLESYAMTSDYVLIQDKKDVLSRIFAYDYNGKLIKKLDLPELGNVSSMSYHRESNTVFVGLATFNSPGKLYKLDGKTLAWTFFYQDTSVINTQDIESKIVFYPSKDGTRIPMFISYKKGLKLDGNNPTMLHAYGGFNSGIAPHYISIVASFINRGGVYAEAGLRGGDEYGEKWHQDGMLAKKQNCFDDFIAGAEYLIKEKYTNPQKLAADGRSNGGLLMGAITTQRPDLFKAVVCGVPLLDMIRYHKFLIARFWIPEYGDPDKKEDFEFLMKYSPYQNIRQEVNYPTMFVFAGENDSRVDPLHAKKFVAAMQSRPAQKNPIMLFMEFDSGHGSGKSVAKQAEDMAIQWRFVMNQLGMK